MNHDGELWQEFADNGEAISGAGFAKPEFMNHAKLCASSHIWLWRKVTGGGIKVLIQLRSKDKTNWPHYWDISVAGHINLHETPLDAAERETYEEVGLKISRNKLHYIFSDRYRDKLYRELRHVFLYEIISKETEFKFNDGEVERLEWVSIDKLKKWVDNPSDFTEKLVPENIFYYPQLFAYIENASRKEQN